MRPAKLTDEQVVALLREAERGEKSIAQLARESGVTEQTIYRWRRKFGGSTVPDVRRLKQLEKDNARLAFAPSAMTAQGLTISTWRFRNS